MKERKKERSERVPARNPDQSHSSLLTFFELLRLESFPPLREADSATIIRDDDSVSTRV